MPANEVGVRRHVGMHGGNKGTQRQCELRLHSRLLLSHSLEPPSINFLCHLYPSFLVDLFPAGSESVRLRLNIC